MARPSGKQLNDIKMFCRGYVACLENQVDIMNGNPIEAYEDYEEWVEWDDTYNIQISYNEQEEKFDCHLYKNSAEGLIEDSFMVIEAYEKD